VFVVAFGTVALSLIFAPILALYHGGIWLDLDGIDIYSVPWIVTPILSVIGIVLLAILLHIARGMGWVHGHLAKNLLVKSG